MTQYLPLNLLTLFAPREPIPYLPPVGKLPYKKRTGGYTGIAAYVNNFEDPKDTPAPVYIPTREERREQKKIVKAELAVYQLEQSIAKWKPMENPSATCDPFKTLFVARIHYNTFENKLRRVFEMYGRIKKIVMVHDVLTKKPRGYAFIEYEHCTDMHNAYKHADGKKIDGRRVVVDYERGRTVKGWFPRRLGGGLGGTRRGGPEMNIKSSGRDESRGDDRFFSRDRDRIERRRSRSRSRERRRRSRSRSRDRHHDRHRRDRSRARDKVRDHDASSAVEKGSGLDNGTNDIPEAESRKERRRSRSRDRERRRRRSRSRERKHRDRDERNAEPRVEQDHSRDQDMRISEDIIPFA